MANKPTNSPHALQAATNGSLLTLLALVACATPPTPAQTSAGSAPPPVRGQAPDLTAAAVEADDRSVRGLDEELARELEAFDALLANEQMELRAEENQTPAGVSAEAAAAAGVDAVSGSKVQTPKAASAPTPAGRQQAGAPPGLRTPDWAAHSAAEGTPLDEDSGAGDPSGGPGGGASSVADDDVVARQLREAAERETDPELREKLWEEYRRYKGQTP